MGDPDHVVIDISKHTGKNGQILYFKAPKQAAEVSTAMRDAGYVGMLRDPSDPEVLLCGRDNLSANKVYQFWPPNASGRGEPDISYPPFTPSAGTYAHVPTHKCMHA